MIGYVTIGVNDMEKAKAFYLDLLEDLGAKISMDMGRIALFATDAGGTMFAICTPFNEQPAEPGNGNMIAFNPGSKELVDKLYHKAIKLGASCDGAPGQRMPDVFYGAYVRDPSGNKLAFAEFS